MPPAWATPAGCEIDGPLAAMAVAINELSNIMAMVQQAR